VIADVKPYPKYKDSGVSWLGELPAHWETRRAKYFFREVDHPTRTGKEMLLSVSHITGVTPRSEKTINMFLAKSNVGHKICRPGDVVINTLWAWMAALGVTRHFGLVSPAYGVYRPLPSAQLLPEFTDQLLRIPTYAAEYLRRSTGINSSRMRLYPEHFLRIPLICPPPSDQAAIVLFLNSVNLRLERAIYAKRKIIALLNEHKQTIIHQTIASGLNPTAPRKPSGFPFLGNLPQHWEVIPFKARIGIQEGPGIMLADFRESGIPLLRISCLAGSEATLNGCNYLSPAKVREKWSHFAVRRGDYLLSASASTGAVRRASDEVVGAIPYTGIIRLWPKSDNVDMEYVSLFMSGRCFTDQVAAARAGVAIEHFGPTHLKRMWIAFPPPSEQRAIVAFVRNTVTPLESAISGAQRDIDLLREYRTRLVADVVTGKLDVREAAARLPEESASATIQDNTDEIEQAEAIDEEAAV
jgi:type I restriction enzyme S subunit